MRNISSSIKPKKRFGQNFLINPHVVDKIISACNLKASDTVIEIGPGKGVLTQRIAHQVKKLFAIEKDKALVQELAKNLKLEGEGVILCHEDFLKFDFRKAGRDLKVIGNIPYYISSPIIEKLIDNRNLIHTAFIMVQLEFGQRLTAKPDCKDYSALSCFVQYYCQPHLLFKIKNTSFYPRPKVQSCFVRLDIIKDAPFKTENEKLLFQIIHQAFGQRRKTLRNSMSTLLKTKNAQNIFTQLSIDPRLRAENLPLKDFIRIADHLHSAY